MYQANNPADSETETIIKKAVKWTVFTGPVFDLCIPRHGPAGYPCKIKLKSKIINSGLFTH